MPLDFFETDPENRALRVWRGDAKFNFGYNDPDLFVSAIKFTVDLSNYRHQELAEDVVGTTFRNKVNSYRSMFEQKKMGKLTGRFGFEGYSRDFSTVGAEVLVDGPVTQHAFSTYGLEELTFERVTLQFGGRIEHNAYNPFNTALLDRSFTGLSAAFGAKFKLWDGGLFVANYSHGFRAPALKSCITTGPMTDRCFSNAAIRCSSPRLAMASTSRYAIRTRVSKQRRIFIITLSRISSFSHLRA